MNVNLLWCAVSYACFSVACAVIMYGICVRGEDEDG
jgi:hypothetical protein